MFVAAKGNGPCFAKLQLEMLDRWHKCASRARALTLVTDESLTRTKGAICSSEKANQRTNVHALTPPLLATFCGQMTFPVSQNGFLSLLPNQ